jgi:hypothetical protein
MGSRPIRYAFAYVPRVSRRCTQPGPLAFAPTCLLRRVDYDGALTEHVVHRQGRLSNTSAWCLSLVLKICARGGRMPNGPYATVELASTGYLCNRRTSI